MAAGSSPQQHRLSTGIFASKLCSGGWNPGSSGKPRKNGSFVRKSGFPQTNHSWIAVVFKLLLIILVVLFQSNLAKAVDEPSKSEENTPEKMEVVENGIDEKKESTELPYKDDQWSPANKDVKKHYDRDFLMMKLQTNPLSLQKPGTLPDNMEVILNTPALENIKSVASVPNLNRAFDMNPQYIRSSTSHTRTPR